MASTSQQEMCDVCYDQQEQLLADGDGSQVMCTHYVIDGDDDANDTSQAVEEKGESVKKTISPLITGVKRKTFFLSDEEFDRRADAKLKRKLVPIKKWRELTIRKTYRVLKLHQMLVKFNGEERNSNYAEMEDSSGKLINAWLTPIIHEELSKYDLTEDTYIKPLGKVIGKINNRPYHDFAIVVCK